MTSLASRVDAIRSKGKSNLARTAYVQLKEDITLARFKPGEYISENMLASALEMSRTPVREALKELAHENLVELMPGRGAMVKDISLKELKEIYELRCVLECYAVISAIDNLTDADIQELELTWLSFQDQVHREKQIDWEAVSRSDNILHGMIINRCSNSYLRNFMNILSQQILRYQLLTAMALGDIKNTIRQHLEIIALLKDRNTQELIRVLREHIEASEKILVKTRS
jgi:DNA-binding GntR family transcriptional regulator